MDRFPDGHDQFVALYRVALQFYAPAFRASFGPEMIAVFQERMEEAASQGRLAMLFLLARELLGLAIGGVRQRVYARQTRPALAGGGVMLLDDRRLPWHQVKRRLRELLPLLAIFLLFRACLAVHFVTLDDTYDVRHVALGDVNDDGLLDAFLSLGSLGDGHWHADRLLLNQGNGLLLDSGQDFGEWSSVSASIGDVTGDGRADIISGDATGLMLYRNQGEEPFATRQYSPSTMYAHGSGKLNVAMSDLNGDGWLDVFLAACCGAEGFNPPPVMLPYSEVWINDGEGGLASNGQQIGRRGANAVALGDIDGDGDVDAVLASGKTIREKPFIDGSILRTMFLTVGLVLGTDGNFDYKTANSVWFNDGQGAFTGSGQRLGHGESIDVTLGDLNGDSSLDLVVGNNGPDEIWINDGAGFFTLRRQPLGGRTGLGYGLTWSVALADFDGDGDLDLLSGGETAARVWLNDGKANFVPGQRFRYGRYASVATGDVDGDGVCDLLVGGADTYRLWRGQGDGRFFAGNTTNHR